MGVITRRDPIPSRGSREPLGLQWSPVLLPSTPVTREWAEGKFQLHTGLVGASLYGSAGGPAPTAAEYHAAAAP
jgi:hypothetical protein